MREFAVWVESKTVEEAAAKMHISQSAMSKHLMALERETGLRLIDRKGKNHLTDAGVHFYNAAVDILSRFDSALDECKRLDKKEDYIITVWDPFVFSGAMSILERHMSNFESSYDKPFRFELKNEAYFTPRTAIEEGLVDIAIDYAPVTHEIEPCKADVESFSLLEEPLVVWCDKRSYLAKKERLRIEDLKRTPIMVSIRMEHPLKSSITALCEGRGFTPVFHRFDPTSSASFFYGGPEGCVYVVTQGMQGDSRIASRKDMVVRKVDDKEFAVRSFVLVRNDGANAIVEDFAEYLSSNTCK